MDFGPPGRESHGLGDTDVLFSGTRTCSSEGIVALSGDGSSSSLTTA
jgi:hypothetical protein